MRRRLKHDQIRNCREEGGRIMYKEHQEFIEDWIDDLVNEYAYKRGYMVMITPKTIFIV